MKIEGRIFSPDMHMSSFENIHCETVVSTLSSPELKILFSEEVRSESFELLIHNVMKGDPGTTDFNKLENRPKYNGVPMTGDTNIKDKPYISLERLRPYLYRITYDNLPAYSNDTTPISGGCSSYVQNGKLYRNLDYNYDNAAEFIVVTKDFEGMAFITGLTDGFLANDERLSQLPYRINDGVNRHGIKVSTHVLFNDWDWAGSGTKSIPLTRLPFEVLTRVKSMSTITSDLNGVIQNLATNAALVSMGYIIQVLVTDGTTTYAIMPPTSAGQSYVLQNITSNPKIANFRWVSSETVTRQELQNRPTGVERFNMMPCSLENLKFTDAYRQPDRLSEFIGIRNTTKNSTDAQLESIYQDARTSFLTRTRNGYTWQTVHSVIYGDKMESLYIQENYNDNIILDLKDYYTAEEIDEKLENIDALPQQEGHEGHFLTTDGTNASWASVGSSSVGSKYAIPSPISPFVITHNLGRYPSVTVIDALGNEVEAEIMHTNMNSLTVSWNGSLSGWVFIV